jgi:lysophospholipase L1-like esterase
MVLLGDSHLARVQRELPRLGEAVVNAAVGGATVRDLQVQADATGLGGSDTVVVSVGTNDAAPCNRVSVVDFGASLGRFIRANSVATWVIMAPPGVDESSFGAAGRTNAALAQYRSAAQAVADSHAAHFLDSVSLLAPLGPRAFAADGLHLSGAAYRLLLPALATVGD